MRSSSGWMMRIALSSLAMKKRSSFSATTIERSYSRSFSAINPPSKPKMMENGPVTSRLEKTLRK